MEQTVEQVVNNTNLFGFNTSTWETIIVALISVFLGGIITYLSKIGLEKRQEHIRIIGLLTEKRIDAYKEIIEALDFWGTVVYNVNQNKVSLVKTITEDQFDEKFLIYPVVLTNMKSLLDFNGMWQATVQNTHLYIDKVITKKCRLISWYLNTLMDTFGLEFYDLREGNSKREKAIEKTMNEIGCIVFDDYHLFADSIYEEVVKYYRKPGLNIKNESLRAIQFDEVTNFQNVFPNTNLFKYNLIIRRRLLENLGYAKEDADDILKKHSFWSKDFSESDNNQSNL